MIRSSPKLRWGFTALWTLLVTAALVSCGKRDEKQSQAPPAPKVTVARVIQREITEWDEYVGRLEAPESVEIRPRVSGYLESIHFEDGQMIKKGDLLFIIDPRPYQAAVERATAGLAQAEAQLKLATTNLSRAKELQEQKAIAQQEYDVRLNEVQTATAAVGQAKATLETTKLDLEFTHVTAPIGGRVSRYYVSVGNLVASGGGTAQATLLTTIVSLDPLYCYFDVDEQTFLKYSHIAEEAGSGKADGEKAQGLPIEMKIGNEKGFPHAGRMDFVDNQVRPETSTIQMRGRFSNPDLKLTPGLFARVRIPAQERHLETLIPDEAVGADQATQFVYIVDENGKAQMRRVELGPIADGLRVVREGLKPNETVIVDGLLRIRPDIPIQVEERAPEDAGKLSPDGATKEETGEGGYSPEGNASADSKPTPEDRQEKK